MCRGFRSRVVAREPLTGPRIERPGADRSTRVAHQTDEEMYIVQGEQAKAEDLVRREEVPDVGARESAARRAVALRVERTPIGAKLGALDVETSIARERGTVASHPCRRDAIEKIHTASHAFHQVFRESHTHEIARPVRRQHVVDDFEDAIHVLLRFPHRQSADAEPAPLATGENRQRRVTSQRLVNATLHNGKEHLRWTQLCRR